MIFINENDILFMSVGLIAPVFLIEKTRIHLD